MITIHMYAIIAKEDVADTVAPSSLTRGLLPERLCKTFPLIQCVWHPRLFPQLVPYPHTPLRLAGRAPTAIVPGRGSAKEPTKPSDVIVVRVELVFFVIGGGQVGKVDFVSQQTADTAEPLDELRALLRSVGHEL
jgi:hypothetical protein